MKWRLILVSLGLALVAGVSSLALAAQEAAEQKSETAKVRDEITANEQQIARQFAEFEQALLKLTQRLKRSEKREDQERAKQLEKVLEESRNLAITIQFEKMVGAIQGQKLTNIGEIKSLTDQSQRLADDLQKLLAKMREDPRARQVQDERKKLAEIIANLEKVIHREKNLQVQTDHGKTDPKELKASQGQVREKTNEIVKDIERFVNKGDKGGEAKNLKGDKKDDGKGEGKAGESKDQGKSGESAKGESKDAGKESQAPKGEAKSGKEGEGAKAGEGKEGDASKKGGEGAEAKAGDKGSKSGEGSQGEAKDKKGGEGGEAKSGEKQNPKAGEAAGAKGSEKKPGEGSPSEAKAGAKAAEAKSGDAKGSKGGEAKAGDPKSGGKGGESKPGEAKSGKAGDSQAKGSKSGESGQPMDQGQQAQAKGDQGQQPNQGPQAPPKANDDIANGKKKIQEGEYNMKRAEDEIAKKNNPKAVQNQEQAIQDLEKAKQKLEKLLRQMREEEMERLLAALQARCEKMLVMQMQVLDGTVATDKGILSNPDKKPTRDQQQQSIRLSDQEKEIVNEANKAIEMLEAEGSAIAFPEVFQQVREDMKHVQRRLEVTDTAEMTQNIERDIIESLKEMIEALKKAKAELDSKQSKPSESKGGPPPDQKLLDKIAELKMIRSLQLRVNTRTEKYGREYVEREGEQTANPIIRRELNNLAERQERIFEITNRVARGDN